METERLVRELTEARGPSGYEAEIREVIRRLLAPYVHDLRVDAMGSLIAIRRGERPSQGAAAGAAPGAASSGASGGTSGGTAPRRPLLMIAAHMDEIALMVTQVEKGFLRITQVGGFDPRVLVGQEVTIHARRETGGVVVSVPPHFTDPADREKPVPLDKLFIDAGLPPEELAALVRVGDLVTLRPRWTALNGGYAACKAMDDRASVAAMILCMEELARSRHEWDVCAVATVQEEVTMAGAATGAWGIEPTAAIAVDVTFGLQAGVSPTEGVKLDGGPGIGLGPNFHPAVVDRLIASARAREIPHQVEAIAGSSGTDAWAIQVSRSGVPCGLVGIPVRSMHTTVETVCLRDVERAARLLAVFASGLDSAFADALAQKDALAAAPAGGAAGTGPAPAGGG
jgi:putative aminopeptidase FrvX